MWKLWNWLFGWQYVWLKYSGEAKICRVTMQPNGELKGHITCWDFFIDLETNKISGRQSDSIADWRALTWERKEAE
jgi:hypothetical protein